ncbi:hypothetical protein BKA65DRAFT_41682 [Rhexocercosporidium sp. MPI-PUGE-AT-0058]|nr:hypothetical protein BKA65DRAFT_41682 [Rhexocercosporidium sp. MPI-PUGE-AT-0058]
MACTLADVEEQRRAIIIALSNTACHFSRVVLLLLLASYPPLDQQKYALFKSLMEYSPISRQAWGYEASYWPDFIFALLNITSDAEELGIKADYSQSLEQTFIKTAVALLGKGEISLLSICQPRDTTDKLPCWVPDFSHAHGRALQGVVFGNDQFGAAKDSQPGMEFMDLSSERPLFKISDFRVDVVKETGTFLHGEHARSEEAMNTWLEEFERFCREIGSSAYPDGGRDMEIKSDEYGKPLSTHNGIHPPRSQRASVRMRAGYQALRQPSNERNEDPQRRSMIPSMSRAAGQRLQERGHDRVELPRTVEQEAYDRDFYKHGLIEIAINRSRGKPFATQNKRYLGIGDEHIKCGDLIVVFSGAAAPYMLSEVEPGRFRLGRECYVHGIMYGELMDRNPQIEQFLLM